MPKSVGQTVHIRPAVLEAGFHLHHQGALKIVRVLPAGRFYEVERPSGVPFPACGGACSAAVFVHWDDVE